MKRHSQNQNLIIHEGSDYSGMPVQVSKGPFVKQYLEKLSGTMELALKQYSRVLAFRVDLRLPKDVELPECVCTNDVISKFLASFKAKIQHNREKHAKRKSMRTTL